MKLPKLNHYEVIMLFWLIVFVILFIFACSSEPKEITPERAEANEKINAFYASDTQSMRLIYEKLLIIEQKIDKLSEQLCQQNQN
jgi:hypothetical protein